MALFFPATHTNRSLLRSYPSRILLLVPPRRRIRIESLPRSFGTPLEWSAADLSELQYPHVEAEVESQRREWTGLFESLKASSPGCGVTQEELNWAMGVAYSRAFRQA